MPENWAKSFGPFSTLGMVEEHNGWNNGRLHEPPTCNKCELVLQVGLKAWMFGKRLSG
jgi:hypothetical protein